MGIELYWDDDDQTIMVCEFDQQWTWEELFATLRDVQKVCAREQREIGAILDLRRAEVPGGLLMSSTNMENARRMLEMGANGTGPIVVVGVSPLIQSTYDMMQTMNGDSRATENISFAPTMKRARAILGQKLPPQ